MAVSMRRFPEQAVVWGMTGCEAPSCLTPAALLYDFERDAGGVPLCLDCADRVLDRDIAVAVGDVSQLPDIWGREPFRRRARLEDTSTWDRTPEMWLAEQGYYGAPVDTSDPDWDIPW